MVLRLIVSFFNTNVPYINTHRLKAKVNFLKLLSLSRKTMKMLFSGWEVRIGRNYALSLDLSTTSGLPQAQFLPVPTSQLVNRIIYTVTPV